MAAVDLPYLRYFRAGPKFNFGMSIAPDYLGDPNDLENSEDCRSAGGHGNQHVRLRSAQIDDLDAICPAPEATPWLRAVADVFHRIFVIRTLTRQRLS